MLDYLKDIYSIPYVDAAQKQMNALIELQKDLAEDNIQTGTVNPRQSRLFQDDNYPLYHRLMPATEFLPLRKEWGIVQDVQERLTGGHDYSGIYLAESASNLVQEYFSEDYGRDLGFAQIASSRFKEHNTKLTGITLPECPIYTIGYISYVTDSGYTNSLSQIKPAFERELNNQYTRYKEIAENEELRISHPTPYENILSTLNFIENIINNCQIFFLVNYYSKGVNDGNCGFRYHKEGAEYLGSPKFEPQHEYFMDDKNRTLYKFKVYVVPKSEVW